MPQTVDSVSSIADQLSERLRNLESRVSALESHSATVPKDVITIRRSALQHPDFSTRVASPWLRNVSVPFATVGTAVLG
ncbi:MAG TPA: hypothetical protein VJQ54_24960, partial [Candidatus Sulfotelmatobacter sp.]|nr:hypothetical protein [Candidatus Sulfotelmatobacter sp.]